MGVLTVRERELSLWGNKEKRIRRKTEGQGKIVIE